MPILVYTFKLNGVDITDSVSVGAVVREILSEPLDIGSLHLPFDINDIEYKLKGLLEVLVQDYNQESETYTKTIKHDLLIIYDDVILSDRINVYTHDLQVIEYTAKFDDYIINSLAYTKALKEKGKAPFEYVLNEYMKYPFIPPTKHDNKVEIYQYFYLDPLNIERQYYNNEVFRLPKVDEPILAIANAGLYYYTYEYGVAFIRIKKLDTGTYIDFGANGYSGDSTKFILSNNSFSMYLPPGELAIEYGFWRKTGGTIGLEDWFDPLDVMVAYSFKIKVINRANESIYDLLTKVSAMVSKFGGIESKQYYDTTRLFTIDSEIVDYLKSVEAPQTYVQNATLRQVLNLIFSYVNSISRLKHNGSSIDILTFDEFDRVTGTFEFEEIASKNVKRSGNELTIKATSNLERAMPTSLDEPTTITPANDYYKTVRAIDINLTETSFELKLEKPIYKPIKFTTLITGAYFTVSDPDDDPHTPHGTSFDLELDLTHRLITKEKWSLKERGTNFPTPFRIGAFRKETGLAKWTTENLFWQTGDKFISMSGIFGALFKETLVKNVILSALEEYATLHPPKPILRKWGEEDVMLPSYELNFNNHLNYSKFYLNLLFNLEYISLEEMIVDSERKDIFDNFDYYSASKLSQDEKLVNIMAQTRGASADLQRTGQRDMVIRKYHETVDDLLETGMINEEHRLTITERTLVLHNEFIEAVYSLSRDFNRKAMFRGLQQEYRWSEIPTSKQVFNRNELYKDYIIIDKLDGDTYSQEITKINSQAHKIAIETLINKDYNESKKITVGYVKTDGMNEELEPPYQTWNYYVMTPITSHGVKGGLSFSFSFDNNMVAGDRVEEIDGSVFNRAVRYTDEDGIINKLWFGMKDKHNELNKLYDSYPRFMTQGFMSDLLIDCGNVDFDWHDTDYLIIHKDSSQVLKITYQVSIIPKNPIDYVIGSMFYSNNLLVKTRDDKKMYLYMYNDEKYKYGIFDTLKIKDGYYDSVLLDDTKVTVSENIVDNSYDFMIDIDTGIGSSELWAIGDEDGNLYIACNSNEIGFKSTRLHFRPNVIEMGKE